MMKETSAVRTAQWRPHPTAPLEAFDKADVEIAATGKVCFVEICGAQMLCNLILIFEKLGDNIVLNVL